MTDIKLSVEEMAEAGVNFGHRVSRLHPKMKPYITGVKNNIHIIDLEKTAKELEKALKFIEKLVSEGKTILFVGTKIQIRGQIKAIADECKFPYVAERWLGGMFTNFETISKRVGYFKDLEAKRISGEFEKYTKKERMKIDKELKILKTKFEGVKNMIKLPEAVIVFGADKDITCIREAKIKAIKIIALCDTNINPEIADYPIPANDDALSSVQYILDKIKEAILNSK
jgi:small subunit ribosomal protein S2